MKDAAVLVITFNRTDTTIEVLKALQIAKPKVLYVFSDGARNDDERHLCERVQALVDEYVTWDCVVHKKIMDQNLGCGPGPDAAIRWALETEDRIIILEDDCVPSPAFFPYCNYLLDKYLEDERIWIVSGNNYCPEFPLDTSYIFSHYAHSQGWATWRRCYLQNDLTMQNWPKFKEKRLLESILPKQEAKFIGDIYNRTYSDKSKLKHIWDIQCSFSMASNGGLGITPRSNLVKNIGYAGTHSVVKGHYHDRATDDSFKIETEPLFIVPDYQYDRYHFKHHWDKSRQRNLMKKAIRKVVQICGISLNKMSRHGR